MTAAELLGPGAARSEALLQASHWLLTAGDAVTAAELLGSAGGAGTPLDRLVRGEMALLEGDHTGAQRLLEEAVAVPGAPDVAAQAAGLLATIAANAGRAADAIEWARRALELGVRVRHRHRLRDDDAGVGLGDGGRPRAAEDEVAAWASRLGQAADGPDVRYAGGVLALWDGRLDEADRTLASMLDDRRVAGRGLIAASARYSLADCWYRQGRWDEALAMAEDLARTLDDSGQLLSSPMAHGVAASVLAARGELDDAAPPRRRGGAGRGSDRQHRRHAVADHRHGSRRRSQPATTSPSSTRCSRWPACCAVQACRRARSRGGRTSSTRSSGSDGWTTRRASWPSSVSGFTRAAPTLGRASPAPPARVAAAGGDHAAAATAFAAGLADDPATQGPFAGAGWSSPPGPSSVAGAGGGRPPQLLDHAIDRFEQLGAAPFLAAAPRSGVACAVDARDRADARALTKAEAAVAALVADGRTNREVAASLVISVKTVESHLARIFDKLGVRSRTELAIEWQAGTVAGRIRAPERPPTLSRAPTEFRVPPDDISTGHGYVAACGW